MQRKANTGGPGQGRNQIQYPFEYGLNLTSVPFYSGCIMAIGCYFGKCFHLRAFDYKWY